MLVTLSEASERNKEPILRVIGPALAQCRTVLEIGSGTGQHAVYFASQLPWLEWQPSDTPEYLPVLRQRIRQEAGANVHAPIELDVRRRPWAASPVEAIFSANTLHIMSWSSVEDFFLGAGDLLEAPGVLCVYGPFRYRGQFTTPSNAEFDRYLRQRDPESGLRDFEAVDALARAQGLELTADHAMPANNQTLIWRRSAA